MNLSLFFAKRYVLGKKSHNAINIVSSISTGGVIFGTVAFVLILSVFNGFDELVRSMYNSFYSDVQVLPVKGKVFQLSADSLNILQKIEGIENIACVLEDNALLVYRDKQTVGRVKGVSDNYNKTTDIDSLIWQGEYKLWDQSMARGVIGRGLAYNLNLNPEAIEEPLKIYVPKRKAAYSNDPNKSLNRKFTLVTGIFASQPDIDSKIIILPLSFAQDLFEYSEKYSSIELKMSSESNQKKTLNKVRNFLGDEFIVKDRYQQNELLYKTMRTEKWAIFLILALVLVILLFSLVGSISMLIIEKKKDISILYSLGANQQFISKIFYHEGLLITLSGLLIGLFFGVFIALVQEKFGVIKLGSGFVIDAYPIAIKWIDLIIVTITVLLIGSFSSWYPVKFLLKHHISGNSQN